MIRRRFRVTNLKDQMSIMQHQSSLNDDFNPFFGVRYTLNILCKSLKIPLPIGSVFFSNANICEWMVWVFRTSIHLMGFVRY